MCALKEFKLSRFLKTNYCPVVRSLLEFAPVLRDPFAVVDSYFLPFRASSKTFFGIRSLYSENEQSSA